MDFKEWLLDENLSMLAPSTGKGGGSNQDDDGGGGDEGGDEWDWERMELIRWNLLKWFKETPYRKIITQEASNIIEKHREKKIRYFLTYGFNKSERWHAIKLDFNFEVDMSPLPEMIRGILQRSDLHKVFKTDPESASRILWSGDAMEYVCYIICLYLSTHSPDSSRQPGSPFTQEHFKIRNVSIFSNYFAFKVWNYMKRNWDSVILPKISEIAMHDRKRVKRPDNWMDVGRPEVRASFSEVNIHSSTTFYIREKNSVASSVEVLIPFEWNIVSGPKSS